MRSDTWPGTLKDEPDVPASSIPSNFCLSLSKTLAAELFRSIYMNHEKVKQRVQSRDNN